MDIGLTFFIGRDDFHFCRQNWFETLMRRKFTEDGLSVKCYARFYSVTVKPRITNCNTGKPCRVEIILNDRPRRMRKNDKTGR